MERVEEAIYVNLMEGTKRLESEGKAERGFLIISGSFSDVNKALESKNHPHPDIESDSRPNWNFPRTFHCVKVVTISGQPDESQLNLSL
jgi:hypothetical protein